MATPATPQGQACPLSVESQVAHTVQGPAPVLCLLRQRTTSNVIVDTVTASTSDGVTGSGL